MEKSNEKRLLFPNNYDYIYLDDYYDPFSGRPCHIMDLEGTGMVPDSGIELQFAGVDVRTGELVSSYYQTVDSIYDYPINHPLIKEEDVLFVDKSKDYYTNIDIVNKNKVSFFEVQEEYYRLLADGLSEKEIHSKMIEEYKTPKKGKTYKK